MQLTKNDQDYLKVWSFFNQSQLFHGFPYWNILNTQKVDQHKAYQSIPNRKTIGKADFTIQTSLKQPSKKDDSLTVICMLSSEKI